MSLLVAGPSDMMQSAALTRNSQDEVRVRAATLRVDSRLKIQTRNFNDQK